MKLLNIQEIELFNHIKQEEFKQIHAMFTSEHVNEGETLFQRGDIALTFYILIAGNFMITYENDKTLTLHKRGDLIGLSSVIPPHIYTGTAIALTEGEVFAVSGKMFLRYLQDKSTINDKIRDRILNNTETRRNLFINKHNY